MQKDKTHWKCFQMTDLSVYYGEVGYIGPTGQLLGGAEASAEFQQTARAVRHGFGVQLFGTTSNSVLCKYEGQWSNDRKHGTGTCTYPDGAVYSGAFHQDLRTGFGKFVWSNGNTYEGNWKEDRMEGTGTFRYVSGQLLKGFFRNNYLCVGEYLVNPFLEIEEQERDLELQKAAKVERARMEAARTKAVHLYRVTDLAELATAIKKCDAAGRVPMLIATQQSFMTKQELFDAIKKAYHEVSEVDLRSLSVLRKQAGGKEQVKGLCRSLVKTALCGGSALVLNMDDSTCRYEELYDPDIHDIVHSASFPIYLFRPMELKSKFEIWKAFKNEEETLVLDKSYQFCIWSKFRIDGSLDDQDVLAKFEKRFSRSVSLDTIDLVLCTNDIQEEGDRSS